ncbi:GTP cyclohydrolase II [Chloroflexota bacterium]
MADQIIVEKDVCSRIPTAYGEFLLCLYHNNQDDKEHLAFIKGEVEGAEKVLARVHSECFTGEVLGSERCDCGEQLERSMQMIAEEGSGVLVYMRQEGRGIGLLEKLRAYNLQDQGYDTVDANLVLGHQADSRDYGVTAAIFKNLGIKSIRLITNNPAKIEHLEELGIKVEGRIGVMPTINPNNERYIRTKINRMNHLLDLPPITEPSDDQDNGAD